MWRVGKGAGWIWIFILLNGIIGLVGVLSFPFRSFTARDTRGTWALRIWSGMFFLMLVISLSYAICTPPLQAPDEPAHLLTLLADIGSTSSSRSVAKWGAATHF